MIGSPESDHKYVGLGSRPACTANASVSSGGLTTSIASSHLPEDAAEAPHGHDPTGRCSGLR